MAKERRKQESEVQEGICRLYLRLNGYLQTEFVLHGNDSRPIIGEVDLIGIRFPFHSQAEAGHNSSKFLQVSDEGIDIVIGEVKSNGQKLQFNKSLSEKAAINGWIKIVSWLGVLRGEQDIIAVANELNEIVASSENQDHDRFRKVVVDSSFGLLTIRPIIFAPETVNVNNRVRFINWSEINDFLWQCLRPESGSRANCETRYDFNAWGILLAPIVKAYKSRQKKGEKFDSIRDLYLELQRQ